MNQEEPDKTTRVSKPRSLWLRWKATTIGNQIVVLATVFVAIANGAFVVVAVIQLAEMKSSSNDTQSLARSAGKQADAAGKIATAAKSQSDQAAAQTGTMAEALNQATAQARAANDLAIQAKRTADIAQQALQVSERAWVGITDVLLRDNIEIGKTLAGRIVLQNTGHTPALHVETKFKITSICGLVTSSVRPDFSGIAVLSNTTLMPNVPQSTGESKSDFPLAEQNINRIKPGADCNLYAFAKITYKDIFGQSHWRHMCAFWDKNTPRTFASCSVYNDGDEDYKDGKEPQ